MPTLRALAVLFLCFPAGSLLSQQLPEAGWEPSRSPLASDFAESGGKISMFASQFPKSFNYQIDNNVFSREIFRLMFEPLLENDPITLEDRPGLADRWEISEDKKVFTFHIDSRAKWSDGKPITSEDVVWSFEAVKDPNHLTGPLQSVINRLVKIEALDPSTVKIYADEVHWKNLQACSAFRILPKHWWKDQDFNKVNFEFPVVSGPYRLGQVSEPHFARMEKRDDYWRVNSPELEGLLNFATIEYRFYSEQDIAFESFKKNEFDVFAVYTSSQWMKETGGDRFDKHWIVKQSIHNYKPIGFQGFAMNMRRTPYDDKKVRKALAHLLDRKRMNQTLMFDQYALTKSYWPDLWDEENPCPNVLTDFDPEKARALLKEAGWAVNPKTGKLEKAGKPFVITFLTRDPSTTKFLLIYEEALNDVGIDLKIDQKDWAAWASDMDEFNYDMTWASWGAGTVKDAEGMWDSASADLKAGNNITGFKNPKVDELIQDAREMFDVADRHKIIRQIDEIIYEESPYVLLWHIDYVRLLYWNQFGTPDHILGKFSDEWAAVDFWWNDSFQADDLKAARASGSELPAPPRDVYFDKVFTPTEIGAVKVAPLQ
ncbi:MAG: ABC transporter substrate-binding protein [Verrucomicrobiales bacterium]|jgi:microcin C transport system substrate-binding protein|nr:ABC transporter substrate-binding protein [Verrucomicrobiales bacterium]HQZ26729.1 extracellular solute-binding protein [Verrucomicrobiales bacterium]